jgi:hypothetical protein
MRERPTQRFRPDLEPLEAKRLLTATTPAGPPVHLAPPALAAGGGGTVTPAAKKPNFGYLVYRITNPTGMINTLTPPFGHVLLQARQPVPGQVYNILMVAVKNGTKQTFDSTSGFFARFPGQTGYFPILKGNEQWKPGQDFIFYVLTKKYYPVPNVVTSGFQFLLAGAFSTAIPGPSGIFLRIKYDPATINHILDYAATQGPGAQGGAGIRFGLPVTSIYAFVSAKENRKDFGGYF